MSEPWEIYSRRFLIALGLTPEEADARIELNKHEFNTWDPATLKNELDTASEYYDRLVSELKDD